MFSNLNIGRRLHLALGAIVLLGFVAAAINYRQLQAIDVRAAGVAQDRWPKAMIANKIVDNINGNAKSVLALMFLTNADEMKKTVARMAEASQELTGLYDQLDKTVTDAAGKELLGRIKAARAAYVGNRKQAIELALGGQTEEAKAMLVGETIPLQKEYLKTIYALIDMQGSAMTAAVTEIEQTVARSLAISVGIGLFTLAMALGATVLLTRSITRPLAHAVSVAEAVAAGRLDNRIENAGRDETGALLTALATMQSGLRDTIGKTHAAADRVAAAAGLSSATQQVAAGSLAQSQATASAAAAIEQLTVSIEHVSDSANSAAEQATGAGQLAAEGSQAVESSTAHIILVGEGVDASAAHIEALSNEVQRIGSIAVVIKDVADQTNLLALNAAIEAARAGEAGRGFAVVADEVRKLAERTTSSVQEINTMIATIQSETRTAVDSMMGNRNLASEVVSSSAGATGSMVHLSYTTDLIEAAIGELSSALREQRSAASDLAQNIEAIAQMSDENSAAVNAVASAAGELDATAGELRRAMAQFHL